MTLRLHRFKLISAEEIAVVVHPERERAKLFRRKLDVMMTLFENLPERRTIRAELTGHGFCGRKRVPRAAGMGLDFDGRVRVRVAARVNTRFPLVANA